VTLGHIDHLLQRRTGNDQRDRCGIEEAVEYVGSELLAKLVGR
jgi:hypothetical protein